MQISAAFRGRADAYGTHGCSDPRNRRNTAGKSPNLNYGEGNTVIAVEKRERLATLREVAGRHGVDLVAAALRFALAPDLAAALVVGTARPLDLLADHAALDAAIPAGFWEELRAGGILHPDAAVPS